MEDSINKLLHRDINNALPLEWRHKLYIYDQRVTIAIRILSSLIKSEDINENTLTKPDLIAYNYYKTMNKDQLIAILDCIEKFFIEEE